jgi:hypothetical protein
MVDLSPALYARRRHGRVYRVMWRDRAKMARAIADRGRRISWTAIAEVISAELGKPIVGEVCRRTWLRVTEDMTAEGVDARYQEQEPERPRVESVILPEPQLEAETPVSEFASLSAKLAEVAETPVIAPLPTPDVIRERFERVRRLQQMVEPPPVEAETPADQPKERMDAASFWGKTAASGAAAAAETQAMWKRRKDAFRQPK